MAITSNNPLRLFFLLLSLCSTIIGAVFVGNKGDKFHECAAVFSVVFIIIGVLFNNRSVLFVLSSGLMYSVIPAFIGAADRNVKEGEDINPYYHIERNGDKVNVGYILMSSGMLLSLVSLLSSNDLLNNIRTTIRRSSVLGLLVVLFLFIINLIGCILIWIIQNKLQIELLEYSIYLFFNSLLFIYFYINNNHSSYYYSAIGYFIFTYYAVLSLSYGIVINDIEYGPAIYNNYYDSNNNQLTNQLIAAFSLIFIAHILFIPVLAHMTNNNDNDNNNNNNNNGESINNNNNNNSLAIEDQPRIEQLSIGKIIRTNIFRLIILLLCLGSTITGCILLMDKESQALLDVMPVLSVVLLIGTLFINNNNQYSIVFYSSSFALLISSLPWLIYERTYHPYYSINYSRYADKKLNTGIILLIVGASVAFFIRVLTRDNINMNNIRNNILSESIINKGAIVLGLFGELIGLIGLILLFIVAGYLPEDYTLYSWTIPVVILLIFAFCILLFSTSIYYRLLFIAVASFLIIRIIDGVQINNIHSTKQDELRLVGLSLLSVSVGLLQITFCILLWPLKSESSLLSLSPLSSELLSEGFASSSSSAPPSYGDIISTNV